MKLEVIEGSCSGDIEPIPKDGTEGCSEGGFMIGCCIIHYWCWDPGHGLCC